MTVEGGKEPYTYAWYLDNQLAETSTSPYFATDNQTVGSHHVYVEVDDAENNSATTLTVEFNVLPTNSSPSQSPPQTQQPTLEFSATPNYTQRLPPPVPTVSTDPFQKYGPAIFVISAISIILIIVYLRKHQRKKKN